MRIRLLPIACVLALGCSSVEREDQQIEKERQSIREVEETNTVIRPVLPETNKAPFKLLNLFDGKIQFDIPERLLPMDFGMFALKYPYESRRNNCISPRQDNATQTDLLKYQQTMNDSFDDNPSIDFKPN